MTRFDELGFAKIDNHRYERRGFPEAVFCEGKTPQQVAKIVQKMNDGERNILATRASAETYAAVKELTPRSGVQRSRAPDFCAQRKN